MLDGMNEQLMQLRNEMDAKRAVMDEKRIALDALRSGYQQVQRNQFEAEKKVVIADTSIQTLVVPFSRSMKIKCREIHNANILLMICICVKGIEY
jgi:hypothetical protein